MMKLKTNPIKCKNVDALKDFDENSNNDYVWSQTLEITPKYF